MTSLVAWIGVDSRAAASLYFASDSRISWGSAAGWNHGRKLFASRIWPDVLGSCGDVVFPSLFLGQAVELMDAGVLFSDVASADHQSRTAQMMQAMITAFSSYPLGQRAPFTVLYGSRDGHGMKATFNVSQLAWSPESGFSATLLKTPERSAPVAVLGTGAASLRKWQERWNRTDQRRTSRAVFGSFCDSLAAEDDPCTGGPPQLVGVYRIGSARTIGTVYRQQRFCLGLEASTSASPTEWRNELFELCDAQNGKRQPDAQKHSVPKGLGMARNLL